MASIFLWLRRKGRIPVDRLKAVQKALAYRGRMQHREIKGRWGGSICTWGDAWLRSEQGRLLCAVQVGIGHNRFDGFTSLSPTFLRTQEGMWSFFELDIANSLCAVASSGFGGLPIFLFQNDREFILSSEIKTIRFALPGQCQVNLSRLAGMIVTGAPPEFGDLTLFDNIQVLPRGKICRLYWVSRREEKFDYLEPAFGTQLWVTPCRKDIKEAARVLRREMRGVLNRELACKAPIALPLSGGVDSSILAAELKDAQIPFIAFTVTYPECEGYDPDESLRASLTAQHLGIPIRFVKVEGAGLLNLTEKIIYAHEIPVLTPGFHVVWELYRVIKESGFKEILSGVGGDGVLGAEVGLWFGALMTANPYRALSEWRRWGGSLSFVSALTGYLYFLSPTTREWVNSLRYRRSIHEWLRMNPNLPQWYESKYFDYAHVRKDRGGKTLHHLLQGEGRRGFYHRLDVILPYLDLTLRRELDKIPVSFKIYRGWNKYLARLTYSHALPREIIWDRRKIGFDVPMGIWMNGPWRKQIKEGVVESPELGVIVDLKWMKDNFELLPLSIRWRLYSASRFLDLFR